MKYGRIAVASLSLSAAGLVGLWQYEGWTDTAVIPVKGDVATVGPGLTKREDGSPVQIGDKIKPLDGARRSLSYVQASEQRIKQCVSAPLYPYEWDAYVSLAYNIGPSAFCASSIPKKLSAGDYEAACKTILEFDGFRDRTKPMVSNARTGAMEYPLVRLHGLTIRRQQEYRKCMGQ